MKKRFWGLLLLVIFACAFGMGSVFVNNSVSLSYASDDMVVANGDMVVANGNMTISGILLNSIYAKYNNYTLDYSNNHSGESLDSKYCIRDDYMVFTQHQNPDGLCWDFAGTQALSSTIMMATNEYCEYSEGWVSLILACKLDELIDDCLLRYPDLATYRSFINSALVDYTIGDGGWFFMFNEVLRSFGMVMESDFDYDNFLSANTGNLDDYYNFYSQFAIKEISDDVTTVRFYDSQYSSNINLRNSLKYHIKNRGAVWTALGWNEDGSSSVGTTNVLGKQVSYKIPDQQPQKGGHAIVIVGWDDSIQIAGKTGAWIALNSWSDTFGDNGMFYIMYEDSDFAEQYFGYVYEKSSEDNLYTQIVSTQNDAEHGYYETGFKGAYYTPFTTSNAVTKQKNVFYSQNIDVNYNYFVKEGVTINSIKIYKRTEDVTSQFQLTTNGISKKIRIQGSDVSTGTYKVVITYDVGGEIEKNISSFIVCDGTEIEYVILRYTLSGIDNNGYYMSYNNYNNCKTIIVATTALSGSVSFSFKHIAYSLVSTDNYYTTTPFYLSSDDSFSHALLNIFGETRLYNFKILKATNSQKMVEIRYDTKGGQNSVLNDERKLFSSSIPARIYAPVKMGYSFDGWYLDNEYTMPLTKYEGDETYWGLSQSDITMVTTTEHVQSLGGRYSSANTAFLYAKYIKSEYQVSFDYMGIGGTNTQETYSYNESITEPSVVEPSDKKFLGWYTDSSFEEQYKWNFNSDTITNDITLYARWVDKWIQVTIHDSSTSSREVTVEYGNPIDMTGIEIVVIANYEIENFYTTENFEAGTEWDFQNDVVTYPIQLYAKWVGEKKHITFHFNNGSANSTVDVRYNEKITQDIKPANPQKEHYTFIGWYTTDSFESGTMWDFENNIITDMHLYANYEAEDLTITYHLNYSTQDEVLLQTTVKYNELITLNKIPSNPERVHYDFESWYTDEDEEWDFANNKVIDNLDLYAKWNQTQFLVTFIVGSNEYQLWENKEQKISYTVTTDTYTVNGYDDDGVSVKSFEISIEKFNVQGWCTDASLLLDWNIKTQTITSEKTLYVKAVQYKFDVSFKLFGGVITEAPEYLGAFVYNTDISVANYRYEKDVLDVVGNIVIQKTGFTFIGWVDEATNTIINDIEEYKITKDMTICARWSLNAPENVSIVMPNQLTQDDLITFTYYLFDISFEHDILNKLITEEDFGENRLTDRLYADFAWSLFYAGSQKVAISMPYKFELANTYVLTATVYLSIAEQYYGEIIEYVAEPVEISLRLIINAKPICVDTTFIRIYVDGIEFIDSGEEEASYIVTLYKQIVLNDNVVASGIGEYTPKNNFSVYNTFNTDLTNIEFADGLTDGTYYVRIQKIISGDVIGAVESENFMIFALNYETRLGSLNKTIYLEQNTFVDFESSKYRYEIEWEDYIFTGWYSADLKQKLESVLMDKNITVYAGWDFAELTISNLGDIDLNSRINETYEKTNSYQIGVEVNYDQPKTFIYSYEWHRVANNQDIVVATVSEAEENSNYLTIKNVDDSGVYYCFVEIKETLNEDDEIVSVKRTNEIYVNIQPAETVLIIDQNYFNENHFKYTGDYIQINYGAVFDRNEDTTPIYYSLTQKQDGESIPPAARIMESGEYTIFVYAPARGNYKESNSCSFTVYIDKAVGVISAPKGQLLTYTGDKLTPQFVLNNEEQNVVISQDIIDVGNYRNILIVAEESDNYTRAEITLSVKVDPARIVIKVKDVTSFWLFEKNELEYEVVSGYSGDVNDLKISLTSDADKYIVGRYDIIAQIDNDNYCATLINGTYTVTAIPYYVAGFVLIIIFALLIYIHKRKRYVYEFIENGGSIVKAIDEANKKDISMPVSKRPGYEFTGWYTDKKLKHKFKNRFKKSRHKTLYAGWRKLDTPVEEPKLDIDNLLIQYKIKKPNIQKIEEKPEVQNQEQVIEDENSKKEQHISAIIKKAQDTAPKRTVKMERIKQQVQKVNKEINLQSMTAEERLNYLISRAKKDSNGKELDGESVSDIISNLSKDNQDNK